MPGMEKYADEEAVYIKKLLSEVHSTNNQTIGGHEKDAVSRVRVALSNGRDVKEKGDYLNVTDYAEKLGVVADALHFLGVLRVNRFMAGKHNLTAEQRWSIKSDYKSGGGPHEDAQESTALLKAFRPVLEQPIILDLTTPVGKRAAAILGHFERQLGGYVRKICGEDLGMTNGEVIETMAQMAENVSGGQMEQQFTREKLASKTLAALLAGPINVKLGKVPAQVIPFYDPVLEKNIRQKGLQLAQVLLNEDRRSFWSTGVKHVDMDAILDYIENHSERYEFPQEEDPERKLPKRGQILSNAYFMATMREKDFPMSVEEDRVAVACVNYLLTKSEAELSSMQENLAKFM